MLLKVIYVHFIFSVLIKKKKGRCHEGGNSVRLLGGGSAGAMESSVAQASRAVGTHA